MCNIRRILCFFMLTVILGSVLNVSSIAADSIEFMVENGVLIKYTGRNTNVIIPADIGITAIGDNAFLQNRNISSVTIPEGVTSIGNNAFNMCSNLSSVNLPDSLLSIGNMAFSNCISLTSFVIPKNVKTLNGYVFFQCNQLSSITIPEGITSTATMSFSVTSIQTPILINNGKTLCYVPPTYSDYTIPDTVTEIAGGAFYGCGKLTTIKIPDGITRINHGTFCFCTGLTSVTIPNSISIIEGDAFYSCSSLKSIFIPDSVTRIGSSAFVGTSITTPIYSNDGKMLCYVPTTFTEYTIPESVTKLNGGAFSGCTGLTTLVIPEHVVEIGNNTFYNCSNLNAIKLPNNLTTIYPCMFYGCSSLKSIVIPSNVTSIGFYAFYECGNLSSIEIPNSVTSIGEYAFYRCSNLSTITIPNKVTKIGDNAFYGCENLKSITIPKSVTAIGKSSIARFYNTIIYGAEGSYAQTYAEEHQLTFKSEKIAIPTKSTVLVNGKKVAFDAYSIDGSNYFKIRDLAKVMNGTSKQFNVVWDNKKKAAAIVTNSQYTVVGGELALSENPEFMTAKISTSLFYLNGVETIFTAYNINGNNYLKLRDIADTIDFGLTWDEATNSIAIDTKARYNP